MIYLIKQLFGLNKEEKPLPTYTTDQLKQMARILFVDDQRVIKADQLRQEEHWVNVRKIDDVTAISQPEVRDAHIIFVDIHGVGRIMGFPDEGLGLIEALKREYPEKKIVLYSAEDQTHVDAFHKAITLVDARLRKGDDLYQFNSVTEELARQAFSFDNCVLHICEVLRKELHVEKSREEVEAIVKRIYNGDLYHSRSKIERAFNLQNIEAVVHIIQLMFS